MFHIGITTQHPPLPEPGQLSEMGIDFIRQCLIIDPVQRPTAIELMNHPWMLDFREKLHNYEEAENMAAGSSPPISAEGSFFENATVARQAAILQEQETELIQAQSPDMSPLETPEGSSGSSDSLGSDLQSGPEPTSSPSSNEDSSGSSPSPERDLSAIPSL